MGTPKDPLSKSCMPTIFGNFWSNFRSKFLSSFDQNFDQNFDQKPILIWKSVEFWSKFDQNSTVKFRSKYEILRFENLWPFEFLVTECWRVSWLKIEPFLLQIEPAYFALHNFEKNCRWTVLYRDVLRGRQIWLKSTPWATKNRCFSIRLEFSIKLSKFGC